ncbi:hypothetical protein FA13DRAFT_1726780 [Coprinellus micaceus]|uniref:Uncharacterized protein n=1 Tax=Coprinellus micaceus TaxID=71717 RepID=A0A4Y7TU09_COPMI|nr:hypothetical protein FA13DRAFT_1726780 [Coprinellus micaceus]
MQVDLVHNGDEGEKDATDFRDDAQAQLTRHENGIAEIQAIIDELLGKQALCQVREQIEKDITSQIDDIVKAQIAACLQEHIPKELQAEVEDSKRELERARLSLHNSESRRMNGKLRSSKPDELLDTILTPDGSVSPHFPKDLRSLFNLDAEACKALAADYDFPQVSGSRDKNLNRIMQFVGVRYQMVEMLASLKSISTSKA